MSQRRTIAVISVSAGEGHLRAAEAIKATAEAMYPDVNVIHVDLMDHVPSLFRKVYAESYTPLVAYHAPLWGYLYAQADKRKIDSALDRLRTAVERLNTQKLKLVLRQIAPSDVICTHFLPAELFSRWRRKHFWIRPVWVVITDFDVHMLWVHRHVTGYFVASDEIACRLRGKDVGKANIVVTGIPIMPAFGKPLTREVCACEVGLNPSKLTLLLMAGGRGIAPLNRLAGRILDLNPDIQVIALAGKNRRLLESLREVAQRVPERLVALPYTQSIERLMACSDLAVTKSGGLTTSECLAMGLPMLIVSPIPGQEERNADVLLEEGAALKAYDDAGLEYKVRLVLEDPVKLTAMKGNALRLRKPGAADHILRTILQDSY